MIDQDDFERFIVSELKKIDIDKWQEGCRLHKDPGPEFIENWIKENAPHFRQAWDESQCKTCLNWTECGWKLLKTCSQYELLGKGGANGNSSDVETAEDVQ